MNDENYISDLFDGKEWVKMFPFGLKVESPSGSVTIVKLQET